MLLAADLERGKKEAAYAQIKRTVRAVEVCHSEAAARNAVAVIEAAGAAASDIECSDPQTLQCIGFAPTAATAYVFTPPTFSFAFALLRNPRVYKVFQNGAFDVYFLKTRCGVTVAGWTDDCMIAWHALWPEIAGKGDKGSKQTKKSLAFLISLYCDSPEWHKDYDTDEAGMYQLCGIDCCTTLEIIGKQLVEMEEQDVMDIYRHEMSMQPVLVAIQERGLLIHEDRRLDAIKELTARAGTAEERMRALAEPLLREHSAKLAKPHLFFGKKRCACCNGGAGKRLACWSCAGLDKAPGKKAIRAGLKPCTVCGGVGSFETFEFNPASDEQKKDLFYNVLKLPERFKDGKPTVDEKALKNLLGGLQ